MTPLAEGDLVRLYNCGGEIAGDPGGSADYYFHFLGVLLDTHRGN